MSRDALGMPDDFANRWIVRDHAQLEAEIIGHREHLPVLDVHKSKHFRLRRELTFISVNDAGVTVVDFHQSRK